MGMFILGVSVVVQWISAWMALGLIRATGKRIAWILFASAIGLMAVRRSITLGQILTMGDVYRVDLWTELVALTISVLMLVAIGLIHPVIRAMRRTEVAEARNRDLRGVVKDQVRRLQSTNDSLRQRVEESELAEQRMRTVLATTETLAESRSIQQAAPKILEAICRHTGREVGELWTIDEDNQVLRCIDLWHDPALDLQSFCELTMQTRLSKGSGLAGQVWEKGEPVYVEDLASTAECPRMLAARQAELHATSGFPILLLDQCFGVLVFTSRETHPPTEELANVMTSIGSQIGQFMERRNSEQELRDTQRTMSTLLSNLPGMVYRCENDRDWTMQFVSEGCHAVTEYSSYDFLRQDISLGSLIVPAYQESVFEDVQSALQEHRHFEVSYPIITASGTTRWVVDRGVGIFDEDDTLLALEGVITDITAQKEAESRIHALARFPEENPNLVMRVSQDGKLIYANPAARRLLGELWSRPNQQLPGDLINGLCTSASSDYVVQKEFSYADRSFILMVAPIQGCEYVNIYGTDITERKQAEEALRTSEAQLRQAQKLEAIGQLAGGVAHDFNNVVTIINGYCELLGADLEPDNPKCEMIGVIQDAATRAGALTRQLLAFSRKQVLAPKVLNLNDVVAETEKMLLRLIGEDVQLRCSLAPDIGPVKADPGQIEQVIMNLVINARDAMPQGGELAIKTSTAELDSAYCNSHWEITPGRYIMLAVSDTGCGMDADTQSRIFEPFFTTKSEGKGTGLGLSTVFGIVKQSGGHVFVYSEPECGTTFKIYLPEVAEDPAPQSLQNPTRPIVRGHETVLLVEDEPALRNMAKRVLQWSGYTVLEARDGDEGLALAKDSAEPIHLLLTDVVMPSMSGRELAEELAELKPDIKVLFMSGYTNDAVVRYGVLHSEVAFLQKPFTPSELTINVRQVLDGNLTQPAAIE